MLWGDDMTAIILTGQELLDIYDASGRSVNLAVLQNKADEMFPERQAHLYLRQGAGRGFIDADGKLLTAKFTIGCGPECIAVLGDGSAKIY